MKKRFMSIVTALAISASFITGCSKGDKVDSTMQSSENGGKQILKFGCFDYVDSIDPGNMINAAWNCTRFGVGECLFRFNDAMEAEPCLCDTYEVSSDHKTWTFHIRDGVKFSNGEDVTAQKVADCYERLFACEGSSTPEKFLDCASMAADDASGSLTIKTNTAYPDLRKNLAYPVFAVLDVENTKNFDEGAIGTGPYAVTEFEAAVGVDFKANQYYWNGEVPFDGMELKFINDSSAKTMALQSGQVDLVENITEVSDLNILKEDKSYDVTTANGVRCGFTSINQNGVLKNDALRQAVLLAVDTDTLCNVTLGGLYTPGFSVLPSNLNYHYDELNNPYAYDVEKAKQLLDTAGIVDSDGDGIRELDGTPVKLNYITYDNRGLSTLAEGVQHLLKEIGIDTAIHTTDGDTLWNLTVSGEYDLSSGNWTTVGTGDPQEYLANWYSKGTANYCNYKNEKYDELYEKLLTEMDEAGRTALIAEMQQILIDDAAVLVHGYYNSSMCSSKKVKGAVIHTADYYWITTEIKPAE